MPKRIQYPGLTKPITPPGEEAERPHLDTFQPNTDIPQANWKQQVLNKGRLIAAVPKFFFTNNLEIFLDKWYKELSTPRWDVARNQFLYPSLFVIDPALLTQSENITLDKWYRELERPPKGPKHWEFSYPFVAIDPTFYIERITLDKWTPRYPDFIWDRPRTQWSYPFLFWHPMIILNPMVITGSNVNVIFPILFQYQKWTIDLKLLTEHENITLDKWFVEHLRQAVRYMATPHLYPYRAFFNVFPREGAFSLPSKRNTTDFTVEAKNTTDFSVPAKNTTDFTPVSKNTTDWTDP